MTPSTFEIFLDCTKDLQIDAKTCINTEQRGQKGDISQVLRKKSESLP